MADKVVYETPKLRYEVQVRSTYEETTLRGDPAYFAESWEPLKRFEDRVYAEIDARQRQRNNTLRTYRVVDRENG